MLAIPRLEGTLVVFTSQPATNEVELAYSVKRIERNDIGLLLRKFSFSFCSPFHFFYCAVCIILSLTRSLTNLELAVAGSLKPKYNINTYALPIESHDASLADGKVTP